MINSKTCQHFKLFQNNNTLKYTKTLKFVTLEKPNIGTKIIQNITDETESSEILVVNSKCIAFEISTMQKQFIILYNPNLQ